MKLSIALALSILTAGLAAAAAGTAAADATNFRFTETFPADYLNGAHCLLHDATVTADVPRVGHATLVFHSGSCGVFTPEPGEAASLSVDLTTVQGDELVLGSGDTGDATTIYSGAWHVLGATGRFASYAGGGTYTASYGAASSPPPQQQVTITFTGTLSPHS